MSDFQKLSQINKIANKCFADGNFVLASKFHDQFMKIAQLNLNTPEMQFMSGLNQAPNFKKIIAQAPKLAGRTDIPTYVPDSSASTVRLVQELMGLPADGAIGQIGSSKTLATMQNLLRTGRLDQMLTEGFKRKFNLK